MGPVHLLPIDISEETFEIDGVPFDPSKLDSDNPGKEKWPRLLLRCLKSCRVVKCKSCQEHRWVVSKKKYWTGYRVGGEGQTEITRQ